MHPHDKVALITGAASGIGKHFAGVLAREPGWRLALADIDEARLRAAFTETERVRLHGLDVRSAEGWRRVVDDTVGRFGRLDYLFNVAGGGRLGFLVEQRAEDVDAVIDLNLKGPIHGMRIAAAVMVRQGSGHVINVASLAGLSPTPGNALYSAAKSGLRAASLAAAVELRERGVYVTVVAPDVVDTPALGQHFARPEAAALIHSGARILSVVDVERAFRRAMRERPLEIALPRWRGWLARLGGLHPSLMLRLYRPLARRGAERLARLRREREGG